MMEKETPVVSIKFDNDGTERVVFNPGKMCKDKLYPFAYQGELWTIRKCQRTVSVMKLADCPVQQCI